jgi:hypothetical protein
MQNEIPGKGHYAYFSSLEKTIKAALAFYLTVLICGIASLSWGVEAVRQFMSGSSSTVIFVSMFTVLAFAGLYFVVNRIRWLGDLHIWLDRRFFGFLEKSNEIIFQALLRVLESDDRSHVNDLRTEERNSLTHSIFSKLADNFHLFDRLMRSGIFRLWIWYWVVNYGTFTFTLLTIGSFSIMTGMAGIFGIFGAPGSPGSDPTVLKPIFTFCWIASLCHLATNIILGHILTRLTKNVAESIVVSYRPEITHMLREAVTK